MERRLQKELKMLATEPPPGVCGWPVNNNMRHIHAHIQGPEGTPYEKGTFLVEVQVPERYPFEPPKVRFITPIYHPNIDNNGRICLDTLKMQPAGSWTPSVNISTLLTTIRLLVAQPNGEDGLVPEITELYMRDRARFNDVARDMVRKQALPDSLENSGSARAASNHLGGVAAAAQPAEPDGNSASASNCLPLRNAAQFGGGASSKDRGGALKEGNDGNASDSSSNSSSSSGSEPARKPRTTSSRSVDKSGGGGGGGGSVVTRDDSASETESDEDARPQKRQQLG